MIYKISLADGSTLDNLTVNGTNFLSKNLNSPDIFNGNLAHISVDAIPENDDEKKYPAPFMQGDYQNMKLVQFSKFDNNYFCFTLAPKSAQEIAFEKINADLVYTAMMSNIDLED